MLTILILFLIYKGIVFLVWIVYENFPVQLIHFEHFAIRDVEFNDIYYSTRKNTDKALLRWKEVVLINTGSIPDDSLFRYRLADLVRKTAGYEPSAIGVDLLFERDLNPVIDIELESAFNAQPNLVLAVDRNLVHRQKYSSGHEGFVNFPISGKYQETIRQYDYYVVTNRDTVLSFALELAGLARHGVMPPRSTGHLHYSCVYAGFCNIFESDPLLCYANFPAIEAGDILNDRDTAVFRDLLYKKIVIMGHLGREAMSAPWDVEDKYMVPTDSSLINHRLLMPGAVIHANAVQALIHDDHFTEMRGWRYELFTDAILLLFFIAFYLIHQKSRFHSAISLLIILGSTIPVVFILGPWLMSCGIYYVAGGLFLQIAFLEEFLGISDSIINRFKKKRSA